MSIPSFMARIIATFIFLLVGGYAHFTQAADPVLLLTITDVNGNTVTNVLNGQTVTLNWYIDGPVKDCVIDNGIGPIDTTVLPVSGSRVVTVPDNASAQYVLSCSGLTAAVVADMTPEVDIWLPDGSDYEIQSSGNVGDVTVEWDSDYADYCSDIWFEEESKPGVHTAGMEESTSGDVTGSVDFGGGTPITEDVTFYITCYNSAGEETTDSVSLHAFNPVPPSPIWLNLWTDTPAVERDLLSGYGTANLYYDSGEADECSQQLYHPDMTPYSIWPDYANWPDGMWTNDYMSYGWSGIQLATTTVFEVTCTRDEVVVGGVTYPAESVTRQLTINTTLPATWVEDRSTLPAVTVTAAATPNPAERSPIWGTAWTHVLVQPRNADYCELFAHDMNGDETYVWDWSDEWIYGNSDSEFSIWLSTTTTLSLECYREYDLEFGDAAEIANGTETFSFVVDVVDSSVPAPAPVVHMYGNAVFASAADMENSSTEQIGFAAEDTYYMQSFSLRTGNTITFPFARPVDNADLYSIHLETWDENDGESIWQIFTEDSGLVGTFTTNSPYSADDQPTSDTVIYPLLASNLDLRDGELITLKCDSSGGEYCRLAGVLFGVNNTAVAPIDVSTGEAQSKISWAVENVTTCSRLQATRADGSTYNWLPSGEIGTQDNVAVEVATTTTFSIRCGRLGDSLTADGSVKIMLDTSGAGAVYTATYAVSTGECIDPVTGNSVTAAVGYAANPTTGICEPAVDLAAKNPSLAVPTAPGDIDNINGTYNNVQAYSVIQNLGAGALPAGSGISYQANLEFLPVYSLPVLDSLGVGYFVGPIAAPPDVSNPTESPTLVNLFNGVPFGTHQLCSRINLDSSPNFPEANLNPANNTSCSNVTLPVPEPPMTLTADRKVIRTNQSVTLDWMINVTYRLDCQVVGASGLNETFNTLDFSNPHNGSFTTGPLTSSSLYTFTCNEPITDTTFTREVTVQMVPDYEEI